MSTATKFYRLADGSDYSHKTFRAIATGEFREPEKGEWYLSGAIIEASKDLITENDDSSLQIG